MKRPLKISKHDRLNIITDYANDIPMQHISDKLGISVDRIRSFLKREGLYKQKKFAKCHLPEQEIINLYRADMSIYDISNKFNVSVTPIKSLLNRHKIMKPTWAKDIPYSKYNKLTNEDYIKQKLSNVISTKQACDVLDVGVDMCKTICSLHDITLPSMESNAHSRHLINQQYDETVSLSCS